MRAVDKFYIGKEEPNRGCLEALRGIILNQDELVTDTMKYGMPCFCYRDKAFCYLWVERKTNLPYILFPGLFLDHSELDQGDRKNAKIFRIDPCEDLPLETISLLLSETLERFRNGTVKFKK